MIRFLAGLCLLVASILLLYLASPLPFYLMPKQERLLSLWQKDLKTLAQKKGFQDVLNQVGRVEVHFNDPQVGEEFANFKAPFRTNSKGIYILKINITRWIEPKEYGFVIEHEIFDSSEDKLHEFGRTYKVGLIF